MIDSFTGTKPPLIIYHGECSDGFCSAWVARLALPRAETYPALHDQEPPEVKDRDVYLLDFAYKRETLEKLKEQSKSLLVLDHHKTAESDLKGLYYCLFNMDHSGARISWDHFKSKIYRNCGKCETPWLVDYTEDRDLDKWQLPWSHEVNAALDAYPMDFDLWNKLWQEPKVIDRLINEGKPIIKYQERLVDRITRSSREVKINNYRVRAVNTATLMGESAYRLARDCCFGVAWFQRADGRYVYSLRSYGNFDVSEVAAGYGGGGHKNSSGFESLSLVF